MTLTAFVLIVASAILHASWNLIAKKNKMTITFYTILCFIAMSCWLHVQFWTPVPIFSLPWKFWMFTGLSVFSDAVLYCTGLVYAYKKMNMASAYPLMRALPLLFIAFLTTALGWGAPITFIPAVGFFIVFCGSLMMPLDSFSSFKLSNYFTPAMFFIILAACGTTGYTIFDSEALGVLKDYCISENLNISKPLQSISYYSTRSICLTSTLIVIVFSIKSERDTLKQYWRERNWMPICAAVCASLTYVLVLMSMNYVTNVSYVQICRQLGLPIGMAAGILILKERNALVKWVGVTLILSGFAISVLFR